MPSFNIVKSSDIEKTFRVQRIMGDFDLQIEHSNEHFAGNIDIPDEWNIGVIVGGLGYLFLTTVADYYRKSGYEFSIVTSAKNLIRKLEHSEDWMCFRYGIPHSASDKKAIDYKRKSMRNKCKTASFIYS